MNDAKIAGQLQSVGIKIKKEGDANFTFIVPKTLQEKIADIFDFSLNELEVGGNLELPELARHVDEQANMEARTGAVAEFLRHYLNQLRLEYEVWHEKVFWKAKAVLDGKPSDKAVNAYIVARYGAKYKQWQAKINDAEFAYRLASNAIHAAWQTKGRMLQTLRLLVQGDSQFSLGVTTKGDTINLIAGGKPHGDKKNKKQVRRKSKRKKA